MGLIYKEIVLSFFNFKRKSMKQFTGVEMIGTIGALLICVSSIPQVIKTYITKSSGDLSILYLSILMLGMILLQIYSISVKDFVFIFGNTLSMIMTGLLIVMWFKYQKNNIDRR
jgi:MtN3 and saliva related transmembrane protein